MEKKLPSDAYEYYVALGSKRSYQAVADHFGVTKATVVRRAVREKWQDKIAALEQKSHARAEVKFLETMDQAKERHLKTFRAILGKGIETLKTVPLTSAMDAVRAIEIAIRNERVILGEPTERAEVSIEQVLRDEWNKWMLKPGEKEDWSDLEGGGDPTTDN